jgi:hypothetical protein
MNLSYLKESDRSRWVAYTPRGQSLVSDIGQIQSWNHAYAWVLFPFRERPHWAQLENASLCGACQMS